MGVVARGYGNLQPVCIAIQHHTSVPLGFIRGVRVIFVVGHLCPTASVRPKLRAKRSKVMVRSRTISRPMCLLSYNPKALKPKAFKMFQNLEAPDPTRFVIDFHCAWQVVEIRDGLKRPGLGRDLKPSLLHFNRLNLRPHLTLNPKNP